MIIPTMTFNELLYSLTGILTGLMAGTLGVGGGLIVVPALTFIFHYQNTIPAALEMHVAAGCSFAIMIFTTQASLRAHYRQGGIPWDIYNRLWPGIILGTTTGALIAHLLPTQFLRIILGFILFSIGVRFLFKFQLNSEPHFPSPKTNKLVCFSIGLKSGILGLASGEILVPYLNYCGINPRKIPSVISSIALTIALLGTFIFLITGSTQAGLPAYTTGYIYWPAVFWVSITSMNLRTHWCPINLYFANERAKIWIYYSSVCRSG